MGCLLRVFKSTNRTKDFAASKGSGVLNFEAAHRRVIE
jgi:hypothetical protein